jgi:hypothetical protein
LGKGLTGEFPMTERDDNKPSFIEEVNSLKKSLENVNQLFAVGRKEVENEIQQEVMKFHQPSPKNLKNISNSLNNNDFARNKNYPKNKLYPLIIDLEEDKENIVNRQTPDNKNDYFSMKFGEKFEESYFNELKKSQNFKEDEGNSSQEEHDQTDTVEHNDYASINLIKDLEDEIGTTPQYIYDKSNCASKQSLDRMYSNDISACNSIDSVQREELISSVFHRDKVKKPLGGRNNNSNLTNKRNKKISVSDVKRLREELKGKIADLSTYNEGIERLNMDCKNVGNNKGRERCDFGSDNELKNTCMEYDSGNKNLDDSQLIQSSEIDD